MNQTPDQEIDADYPVRMAIISAGPTDPCSRLWIRNFFHFFIAEMEIR
jgi:hypothetical protein